MFGTFRFLSNLNHGQTALVIGYANIVLGFLLVYFGIRSYRDNLAGRRHHPLAAGFAIGICITLISCVFYVVAWEIVYFNFMSHSMDGYFAAMIQKAQSGPGTPEAIQAKVAAIRHSQQAYQNPFINALYTFIEPFPGRTPHHPHLRRHPPQEAPIPTRFASGDRLKASKPRSSPAWATFSRSTIRRVGWFGRRWRSRRSDLLRACGRLHPWPWLWPGR